MKLKRFFAAFAAAVMMLCSVSSVSAESVLDKVTMRYYKTPAADASLSGKKLIGGRLFVFDSEGVPSPYTGKYKTNKGTRYFIDGSPWFGWMKISGAWYYFDPSNGGYMAVSTAKTALGTYKFSEDGKWTGKYTASAKAPSDFSLYVHNYGDNIDEIFDTGDNKLMLNYFTLDNEKSYTKRIAVSKADKQILYDMFMSCNVNKIKTVLDGETLSAANGSNEYYAPQNLKSFCISVNANGKNYTVKGDNSMYSFYDDSTEVRSMAYYTAFINNYMETMSAYKTIMKAYEG